MSKYENRHTESRRDYEQRRMEERRRRYEQDMTPKSSPKNNRKSRPETSRKKGSGKVVSFFTTLLLIIAIAVFCFAAYKLVGYYLAYKAGSDEYAKLNDQFVQITAAPTEASAQTEAVTEQEDRVNQEILQDIEELENPDTLQAKVDNAAKEEVEENGTRKVLPVLRNPIDFTELQAINEDIIGWIRIGALDISYPVARGEDNEFYLHRTFEKQDNFAGCIFLNCDNSKFFTDQNSIVYGHNMKNGSMFGTLKNLRDQETYDSNPYFWIFTPTLIYQYKIFNCSIVSTVGDPYRIRFTTEDFQTFIDNMQAGSVIDNHGTVVTTDDRITTLSTCTGNQETRFICQGVLKQIYAAA